MDTETNLYGQPPGYIIGGVSVGWLVKPLPAFECPERDGEWCNITHKGCCFAGCPRKIDNSFVVTPDEPTNEVDDYGTD